jgi:hypothetical protein
MTSAATARGAIADRIGKGVNPSARRGSGGGGGGGGISIITHIICGSDHAAWEGGVQRKRNPYKNRVSVRK